MEPIIYSDCTVEEATEKHHVQVRAYYLCSNGKKKRQHCSDATHTTQGLIGSSGTSGDCPTCLEGLVSKTVSQFHETRDRLFCESMPHSTH